MLMLVARKYWERIIVNVVFSQPRFKVWVKIKKIIPALPKAGKKLFKPKIEEGLWCYYFKRTLYFRVSVVITSYKLPIY